MTLTRRQTLLGASAMAVAPAAILEPNTGILDGLPLSGHLNDAVLVRLSPGKYFAENLTAESLEELLSALHRAVHAPLRIEPTHLLISPEVIAYYGSPEAARKAYDDAVRYLDTVHG